MWTVKSTAGPGATWYSRGVGNASDFAYQTIRVPDVPINNKGTGSAKRVIGDFPTHAERTHPPCVNVYTCAALAPSCPLTLPMVGMDSLVWMVTIPTLIIFFTLAALLLVPIWRFLDREEEVSKQWTPEAVERRLAEHRAQKAEQSPKQQDTSTS